MEEERHEAVTYMDDIVPRALVLRVLGATIVISVVLCVIAYLLLVANERAYRADRKFPERDLPAPHEVANVRQELFAPATPASSIADDERVLLDSYGWVDRDKRIARIPVARAVELMLQKHGGAR
jgi:predicted LPLAT superfamily acyltransferase